MALLLQSPYFHESIPKQANTKNVLHDFLHDCFLKSSLFFDDSVGIFSLIFLKSGV